MRWLTFAACGIVGLVLQTTLAGRIAVSFVKPDWMFVLVVFFALYARRRDAYLAGWILGLAADLMSLERLGLLAIGYTLTAVMVNAVRDIVFLKNAATHFSVTLGAGLILQAGLSGYRVLVFPGSAGWSTLLAEAVATALYTAVWAIPIHHLLLKCSSGLGLHTSRFTHVGLRRVGHRHV